MKTKQTIIHVISPLFLGGLIYISFRATSLRMFDWFEMVGIDSLTQNIRAISEPCKNYVPSWFYYSLPDGLWVYSFTSALLILWNGKLTFWLLLPLVTGVFVEVAQGLQMFPGTFDIIDLTFTAVALLLSFMIINSKKKKNEEKVF